MKKPTDLEGRLDQAMKKGEKQDRAKRTSSTGYMVTKKEPKESFMHAHEGEGKNCTSCKHSGMAHLKEGCIDCHKNHVAAGGEEHPYFR